MLLPKTRRIKSSAILIAGLLCVSGLAGCGSGSASGGGSGNNGSPSASAPTSAQPIRSVTADNLLTVEDVPNLDPMTYEVVEADAGTGRPVQESYSCLPTDGLASLGATAMVTRDFTVKVVTPENDLYPKSPLKNKPSIYTQALQFPDQASATAARAKYASWIAACPKLLDKRGYTIDTGQSVKLTKVRVSGGQAQAGMVAYAKPDAKSAENLYWESAGVTQVGDRLMITIAVTWGPDTPGGFDTSDGDSDFMNPEAILIENSVPRLKA